MVLSFKKQDLDDAHIDDRFPDSFRVDLIFSSSGNPVPAILPSLSDGSLVTLAASTPEDSDVAAGRFVNDFYLFSFISTLIPFASNLRVL